MKKLFLSLVALVMATMSYAQNNLVATLTHGDEISMFYGTNAFVNAHTAAVDGDVINLSGGKFNSKTITKGITIRGTGTLDDNPTIINSLIINVPEAVTEQLNFEGCTFGNPGTMYGSTVNGILKNAHFLKCNFYGSFKISGTSINATFINCYMSNFSYQTSNNDIIQFINCRTFFDNYSSTSSTIFINCVVSPYSNSWAYIGNSQLVNCILCRPKSNSSYSSYLPATSSAWNCVSLVGRYIFDQLSFQQNCSAASIDIFIDSDPMNDLTDEAKAQYLGNDGTPVGMYGGVFPYNMVPSYPTITKMNVANKTTADGKLSVEIEVNATE